MFCSLVPKNSDAFFGVLCKEMWTDVALGRNIKALRMVSDFTAKNKLGKFEKVFSLFHCCFCDLLILIFLGLAFYFTTFSPVTHSLISFPPSTDVAVSREKKITGHCLRTLSRTCYQQLTNLSGLLQSFCSVCLVDYWLV